MSTPCNQRLPLGFEICDNGNDSTANVFLCYLGKSTPYFFVWYGHTADSQSPSSSTKPPHLLFSLGEENVAVPVSYSKKKGRKLQQQSHSISTLPHKPQHFSPSHEKEKASSPQDTRQSDNDTKSKHSAAALSLQELTRVRDQTSAPSSSMCRQRERHQTEQRASSDSHSHTHMRQGWRLDQRTTRSAQQQRRQAHSSGHHPRHVTSP